MNPSTLDEILMDVHMGRPDLGPTWDRLVPDFIMTSIFPLIIHVAFILH